MSSPHPQAVQPPPVYYESQTHINLQYPPTPPSGYYPPQPYYSPQPAQVQIAVLPQCVHEPTVAYGPWGLVIALLLFPVGLLCLLRGNEMCEMWGEVVGLRIEDTTDVYATLQAASFVHLFETTYDLLFDLVFRSLYSIIDDHYPHSFVRILLLP
ncbi:hypothetical protein VNI00_015860 [Paramarasmius palmivorus]|uniref:Uncharacterized protein n=1 Tax=Paramarasmius palmivorus TaxID=297713 RepID=A0AAW0BH67_9AGAR